MIKLRRNMVRLMIPVATDTYSNKLIASVEVKTGLSKLKHHFQRSTIFNLLIIVTDRSHGL